MAKAPLLVASSLGIAEQTELYAAIEIWEQASEAAAKAVADEKAAREAITSKWFKDAEEGANTITLKDGKLLKADCRINRKVDKAQYEAARTYCNTQAGVSQKVAERMQRLAGLLDEVFRMTPELNTREWKELDAASRKLLADIVTEAPGTPNLKLESSKK